MDSRTGPEAGQARRFSLGVVMMDTGFPRLRGDVGNARTWPFPVTYRIVRGAHAERVARSEPDQALLGPFVEAARDLAAGGAQAIVTSCGFLAIHQPELAAAVPVPVFASALLQVPLAARLLRPGQRVAIFSARGLLTERHYRGAGWSPEQIPVVQVAPPPEGHFVTTFGSHATEMDPAAVAAEVTALARRVTQEHPDIGAIVLECTNFVPFAQAIRRITQVPVFDLYTLALQARLTSASGS